MAKETKLQIVIDAKNNTNAGFAALKKQLDVTAVSVAGISDAMKSVGKVGAVAFTGLTAFIGSSVKTYGDTQLAIAKVDATLKAMGKTAEGTRSKIMEASQAVVRLGFDDDNAAVSITKFYQRTNDLNKAIELNALAMDLARSKSVDLATASQMVNLAMSGNMRALREFGVELDETMTPMEAIAGLQKMVAGQAEEATTSIAVQGQVFKETFANLQDVIGKQFIPVLTQALQTVTPVIEKLGVWIEKNPELAKTVLISALALTGLLAVMLPIGMALPGLVLGFQAFVGVLGVALKAVALLFSPMGLVAVSLGVIGYSAYKVAVQWQDAWDLIVITVAESANFIQTIIEGVVNTVVDAVNGLIGRINTLISKMASIPTIGKKFQDLSIPTLDAFSMQRYDTGAVYNDMMSRPKATGPVGNMVVNVTGNNFLDQYGAEEIGNLIMQKLKMSNAI